MAATPQEGSVSLDWNDNGESDLAGYTVYRGTSSGGPYNAVNGTLLTVSEFTDTGLTGGVTYWYVVTARDNSSNESTSSSEVSTTPTGGGGGDEPVVWINEFHYDNDGGDKNEFVEVAGPAGTDLTGWTVAGYNGADGSVYMTVGFSGSLTDQMAGFGTQDAAMVGMQNGSPDALALVDGTGTVIQFLSYEGSFTAVDGPAAGLTSTDIGISEPSDAPRRTSLQLFGTGSAYADFNWEGPLGKTDGSVNENQIFVDSGGGDTTPPAVPTGLSATAGDGSVSLDWNDNGEGDLDGYTVYRAASSGGPYTALNGSLLSTSAYDDNSVSNGTTYYFVVTATDLTGNESAYGGEVNATPQASGGTTPMHVDAITLTTTVIRNKEYGHATVMVVDDLGSPVVGATVTGTFTGSIPGADSAVTGADGIANLTSPKAAKPSISFTFCVDNIALSEYTYDSGSNTETCDSH